MAKDRIIHLPAPRFRRRTSKRTGKIVHDSVVEEIPVQLRCIPSNETPVEISAIWSDNLGRTEISWRYFEGSLWRPIMSANGRIFHNIDEFIRQANLTPIADWLDYPFQFSPYLSEQFEIGGLRFEKSGGEAGSGTLFTSSDLIAIDDILFKRAPGPVWSTCFQIDQGIVLNLRLLMPDFPTKELSLQSFCVEDFDKASAFMDFIFEECEYKKYEFINRGYIDAQFYCERHARNFELPNERNESFQRTVELIESAMRHLRVGEISTKTLGAYLRLIETSSIVRRSAADPNERSAVQFAPLLNEYVNGAHDAQALRQTIIYSKINILREIFEDNWADIEALSSLSW